MRFQKLTADQLAALNAGQSIEIVLPHHAHDAGDTFWLDGHELKVMSAGNTQNHFGAITRQRLTIESLSVLPDDSCAGLQFAWSIAP